MRRCSKIYEQMPHQMVMAKSLLGVEYCTYCVENSAQRNERYESPRSVTQKQREEEYDGPAHNQINRKTYGGYRATAERFIKDTKNHHHPLQNEYQPTLPATYYRECNRRIAARNGNIDKYVVKDVKNLFVTRVVQHRVIKCRD